MGVAASPAALGMTPRSLAQDASLSSASAGPEAQLDGFRHVEVGSPSDATKQILGHTT